MQSTSVFVLASVLSASALPVAAQLCDIDLIYTSESFAPLNSDVLLAPIASGDIDNDGDRDVIHTGLDNGSARVYLNDGLGGLTYSPVPLQGADGGNFHNTLADFNNDGFLDLAGVRGGSDGGDIVIFNGNGDGTFGPAPSTFIPEFIPDRVFTADIDGDGFEDIVAFQAARSAQPVIVTYRNAGNGTFTDARSYDPVGGTDTLQTGDLDGDGLPEIVTTSRINSLTTILRNLGDGTFSPQSFAFTPGASGGFVNLQLGDLNNDGHLDIAYSLFSFSNPVVFYTLNNGAGNFQTPATEIVDTSNNPTWAIAILDADGDGDNDILRMTRGLGSIFGGVLERNDGTGAFTETSTFNVIDANAGFNSTVSSIADFNNDGTPDVLLNHDRASPSEFGIWFNTCFAPPVIGQQPVSRVADAGDTVDFSIAVSNGAPPLTYQWRRDGIDLVDDAAISGANSPTLVLSGIAAQDIAMYDCVVSNPQGTRTSERATLAIRGAGAPACTADLNGDGVLDFFDVSTFISAFNMGCP